MIFILRLSLPSPCLIRCESYFFTLQNTTGILWFDLTLVLQPLRAEPLYFSVIIQWSPTLTSSLI